MAFHHCDDVITDLKFICIQNFIKVCERNKVFLFNLECQSKSFVLKAVNFSWQWSMFTSFPCHARLSELKDFKIFTKKHRNIKKQSSKKFLGISGFTSHRNSCIYFCKKSFCTFLFESHLTRVCNKRFLNMESLSLHSSAKR